MTIQANGTTIINSSRNLTIQNPNVFIGDASAALGYGAVGTYAMLAHSNAFGSLGTKPEGTTISGGVLRPGGIAIWTTPPASPGGALIASYASYRFVTCGGTGPSGTWMIVSREVRHGQGVNIWLRIS